MVGNNLTASHRAVSHKIIVFVGILYFRILVNPGNYVIIKYEFMYCIVRTCNLCIIMIYLYACPFLTIIVALTILTPKQRPHTALLIPPPFCCFFIKIFLHIFLLVFLSPIYNRERKYINLFFQNIRFNY